MPNQEYKRDKRSPVPKSEQVSKLMSRIKRADTKPEVVLRKGLYNIGLRGYRKNYKDLPGKPDIAFTRYKIAIFINGCYWHGCVECGWKPPKHNSEYWINKIQKNRTRDEDKKKKLENLGYTVVTIWEHELKKEITAVLNKIKALLQ